MSNLRERAREIKAAGEEERGNFQPTGVPLRVYKYWAKHAIHVPERENFCHFWRVVLLWAPLMVVRRAFMAFITSIPGAILSGLVATAVLAWAVTVIGAWPLVGVASALVAVLAAIFGVIFYLDTHLSSATKDLLATVLLIGFFGLFAVMMIVGIVVVTIEEGWWFPLMILGVVVAVIALITGLTRLGEFISGRRKVKRAESDTYFEDYFERHGEYPTIEPKQPGRIKRFFSGVGDFLILLAQIIRVKKWKICPIVTIEK